MANKKQIGSDVSAVANAYRAGYDPITGISSNPSPLSSAFSSSLPSFLQNPSVTLSLPDQSTFEPSNVAHVYPGGNRVYVDRPSLFSKGVLTHEMTHVYQGTRQDPTDVPDNPSDPYDYGSIQGLVNARNQRRTIRNFSSEQQAAIVQHYYEAHQAYQRLAKSQGFLTPDQSSEFEKFKAAYEPFIQQLAGMTPYYGNSEPDVDTTPPSVPTPSVPPGPISGISSSPIMGGVPMKVMLKNIGKMKR